jgi:hypothetical protein
MPEDLHGWYCPTCCPACKAQPALEELAAPHVEEPLFVGELDQAVEQAA